MPSAEIAVHTTIPPQRVDRNGLSIREDVLYTDVKGREKARLRKRAERVFDDFGDVLRRVLEPNETIFYIAVAQVMPGAATQFFGGGWHTYSLPRTLLFLTERRIIALRVRRRAGGWKWNRGIRTVRWGDIESTPIRGFASRYLTLKFRDGEKLSYFRFGSGDLKKARLLIDVLRPNGSGETTAAGAMKSLCPVCLAALSPRNYQCPGCGQQFKDEKTLVRRGILIPGGASFYVGSNVLGALRAFSESIFLLVLLGFLAVAISEPKGSKDASIEFAGALFVLGVLALDKLMAIAVSRNQIRDFLPIK
ncbi:MAG TPA: hypothetical protein VJO53_00735 [Candidatus Acidoferrales bacterium]|nr:hypothetical protein [Candidatus Acidoferrales bacterium]